MRSTPSVTNPLVLPFETEQGNEVNNCAHTWQLVWFHNIQINAKQTENLTRAWRKSLMVWDYKGCDNWAGRDLAGLSPAWSETAQEPSSSTEPHPVQQHRWPECLASHICFLFAPVTTHSGAVTRGSGQDSWNLWLGHIPEDGNSRTLAHKSTLYSGQGLLCRYCMMYIVDWCHQYSITTARMCHTWWLEPR